MLQCRMLAKDSEAVQCSQQQQGNFKSAASFREMWDRRTRLRYVGEGRADQLMPFRLAVWRKLACLRMTRCSWLIDCNGKLSG